MSLRIIITELLPILILIALSSFATFHVVNGVDVFQLKCHRNHFTPYLKTFFWYYFLIFVALCPFILIPRLDLGPGTKDEAPHPGDWKETKQTPSRGERN